MPLFVRRLPPIDSSPLIASNLSRLREDDSALFASLKEDSNSSFEKKIKVTNCSPVTKAHFEVHLNVDSGD